MENPWSCDSLMVTQIITLELLRGFEQNENRIDQKWKQMESMIQLLSAPLPPHLWFTVYP